MSRYFHCLDTTPLQRALNAAPQRAVANKARPDREFFCFRLGGLNWGIPSENVREVIRAGPLTPLPRSPSYLMGVCGHRGEVLPVMDLLRYFAKGEAILNERTRLFVGVASSHVVGMVADVITGLRRVLLVDIHPPPLGGDVSSDHVLGVVHRDVKLGVLTLLDFPKVLQAARSRAVNR